jgi:hypothetical protein
MFTKRMSLLALALAFAGMAMAQDRQDKQDRQGEEGKASQERPAREERAPLVINLNHGSSGGHNRNYPSQQAGQAKSKPSWGQVSRPAAKPQAAEGREQAAPAAAQRQPVSAYAAKGQRAGNAAHHHPYTQGYVRKKLQNIGVATEPKFITDRSEIVHTDRKHSSIALPNQGADGRALKAVVIKPRGDSALLVRSQMAMVSAPSWRASAEARRASESQPGRYYWHQDQGFDYCHYRDDSGYDWYGWYMGDQYFWTRDFNGRWWWYDADNDRWDFYNDGYWWWQDPNHVGDLYCYSDEGYIPANSQEDQVVMTQPVETDLQVSTSPDGTRTVKVLAGSDDAFLYDTANPPSFDPIYLASGVQRVEFSDPSNGRPLEIVLKLDDGSFDLFDGDGHPYNAQADAAAAAAAMQ